MINLGPIFDAALAQLAGVDPSSIDPGSIDITMINPTSTASTTVRFVIHVGVNTVALKALIATAIE